MAIAKVLRARPNDTLCGMAVDNGFRDCRKVRDENAGAEFVTTRPLRPGDSVNIPEVTPKMETGQTEMRHRFRRPGRPVASIRFVHGSKDQPFERDATLRELNVSNYVTTRAGVDGTPLFSGPAIRTFHPDSHEDEDAFKVEVRDLRTREPEVDVVLEALRPTYNPAGRLNGHTNFPGDVTVAATERGRRSLRIRAERMAATKRFRTAYLRLAVDGVDDQVAPHQLQTLLSTDMVVAGDPQVEILDQDVRAEYVINTCPGAPAVRCRVTNTAPIGRGQTADLAVRVCRTVPNGAVETVVGGANDNGIVGLADIKRRIETFCRRAWAQSHVRFRIVRLETVDLPSNMIAIADLTGNVARGSKPGAAAVRGQIGFTVRVTRFGRAPDSVHVVGPFDVPPGNTPEATANLIRTQVNALPGIRATPSVNPPEVGNARGSADVLFTDLVSGGRITITNPTALADQDADQQFIVSNLTMAINFRNAPNDGHVDHPDQRNLIKALDTGDNLIDIIVVGTTPGARGVTMSELKHLFERNRPMTGMRNTCTMPQGSADGTNNNPFSLPHEIGHVLTDDDFHAIPATELMVGGTSAISSNVGDSKRIIGRAPTADNWQINRQNADGSLTFVTQRFNAVERILRVSDQLLH